jgi:hypothetical protein
VTHETVPWSAIAGRYKQVSADAKIAVGKVKADHQT